MFTPSGLSKNCPYSEKTKDCKIANAKIQLPYWTGVELKAVLPDILVFTFPDCLRSNMEANYIKLVIRNTRLPIIIIVKSFALRGWHVTGLDLGPNVSGWA